MTSYTAEMMALLEERNDAAALLARDQWAQDEEIRGYVPLSKGERKSLENRINRADARIAKLTEVQ